MKKAFATLPEKLRTYVENLPFPESKFVVVVYDSQGTIHYHTGVNIFPNAENMVEGKGLKITELVQSFNEKDSGPFLKALFSTPMLKQMNCLINANASRERPPRTTFSQLQPAQIKVTSIEGFFVAGIHPISYFVDRAISRTSPNILVILDENLNIIFFSNRFWGAVDDSNTGPILKMEMLTDPVQWKKLLRREKDIQAYFVRTAKDNSAPWRDILKVEAADPAQWVSQTDFPWSIGGGTFEVNPKFENSFLTLMSDVDQLHHDVRVEITTDLSQISTLGVVFNANIYRSNAVYLSPDIDGYNFAVSNHPNESHFYVRLKKSGRIVDECWIPSNEVTEKTVRMAFQKSGGLFTLSLGDSITVNLYDTDPTLPALHHFIGFLGGAATRFSEIKILSRRTRFNPKEFQRGAIDLKLYGMPQHLFEANLQPLQILGKTFQCLYLNEVTQNRRLLKQLNKYVAEIEDDLQMAKRIQTLLTRLKVPSNENVGFVYHYKSSGHVGGDMLDVKDLGDDQWGLLIYDVSGHGVAASLICSMAKMSFDNAFKHSRSPAVIAKAVNDDICAVTDPTVFLTAFIGVLDMRGKTLTYTRAGHCHPLLFPSIGGNPRTLEEGDSVIGYLQDFNFSEHRVLLSPGDRLLLYTDGLIETRNSKNQFLGKNRVMEAVRANHDKPIEQVKGELLRLATAFAEERPFEDDMAFMLLELKGAQ